MKISNFNDLQLENVAHKSDVKRQRFLHKGDMPALTNFSRAFFEAGQEVEEHVHHDMHEVFYVLSGEAEVTVDGEDYLVKSDDVFWVEAGESHQIKALTCLQILYFGIEEGE
ncbi:cupin domain-containing protein [Lentisphaera marina]|uniref:cupin domain-containing protein n=1 Tax=Lentisphaera marina TaxID=1111041 RepID=UPI002366EF8A|nr:cupin domain-containing protein [Lentisphaera marina]MDD7985903.1 cupin domain-containing protein [Lentisphaera marina]